MNCKKFHDLTLLSAALWVSSILGQEGGGGGGGGGGFGPYS